MKYDVAIERGMSGAVEGEIPALSLLLGGGPYGADAHVDGHEWSRLEVGDGWPFDTPQGEMTAHLAVRARHLSVCLALRFDDLDDGSWMAFQALPIVAGFLATAQIGWFLTDSSGVHMRAPLAMERHLDRTEELRRCLVTEGVRRSLTLFGIGRGTVRSIHIGFALDRLWELLHEGLGEVVTPPPFRSHQEVLAELAEVPKGVMFAEAVRRHLSPKPASSASPAGGTPSGPARRGSSARRRTPRR